MRWWAY
ncbi:hypothetical protein YPPY45_2519, partial [Yersinia pestis PY-45]